MKWTWMLGILIGTAPALPAEEPALPSGLGGSESVEESGSEPALPAGLGGGGETDEAGAGEGDRRPLHERLPVTITGFAEARAGVRTQSDPYQEDRSLSEGRLQLGIDRRWPSAGFKVVGDVLYDDLADTHQVDLNRGEGWLDLRQANVFLSPLPFADVKAGRQILTWGTGDLLFINDNFPKDWQSFLSGRDEEYLKAPSDALKVSLFSDAANLDVVYTPQFDPDRFIRGERLSYYNSGLGRIAGEDALVQGAIPDDWFADDEWALRLYRNLGATELALYGYDGFWKSPGGQTPGGLAAFPRLTVYGASVRGSSLGGIANAEVGYYDSRDDRDGDDPRVRNSEWRALLGYERDLKAIAGDLTLGLQAYVEVMDQYGEYRDTLPAGIPARDEVRNVLTARLTKLLMQQTLTLSAFAYYSPTDQDAYLRPLVSYDVTDEWKVEAGGNFFLGEDPHTFFGQFDHNDSVYAATRYSF